MKRMSRQEICRIVIEVLLVIAAVLIVLIATKATVHYWNEADWAREARSYMDEDAETELFRLYSAIATVESENNPNAFNPKENAAGLLQIRPICVVDCNRISKSERWSLSDRYSPAASFKMFKLYVTYYQEHYDLSGPESAARIWNGGPRGWEKESTLPYWKKVKKELEVE